MQTPIREYVAYFLTAGALLLLICSIHAALQRRRHRRATRARGFAVATGDTSAIQPALPLFDQGPGIHRITGVISASGDDVQLSITAHTLANAKVKAELKGIVVTDIVKVVEAEDPFAESP